MLEIVKAPDPVLSQKAKPIVKFDKGLLKLIEQMKESVASAKDPVGVGLAAPQIGKSLQIFIAKPSVKSLVLVFINPKITDKTAFSKKVKEGSRKLEGCLSLPNIWGEVERFQDVVLEYQIETGKKHKRKFSGFIGTIIQHEVDHLNGVLFPKRVLEQKGTLYKSEKDEKGEDVFEEIKV